MGSIRGGVETPVAPDDPDDSALLNCHKIRRYRALAVISLLEPGSIYSLIDCWQGEDIILNTQADTIFFHNITPVPVFRWWAVLVKMFVVGTLDA